MYHNFQSGGKKQVYTLDPYERRLVAFLSDSGVTCDEFVDLAKMNSAAVEKMIINYVLKEKHRLEQGRIATSTISNKNSNR
jgi:hypothetical protein